MKAEKKDVTATVINVDVEKDKKKKASKGLVSRLSKKKTPPTQEQLEAASQVAQTNRDDANQAKAKKAAQESKKVDEAQANANTDKAKAAKEKAEKEAVAATIINVNVGKDPNKKVNKNLVKRLSLKKNQPLTKEQLDAANEVAQANRDDAIQAKAKKAAQESKKVDEAQVKANTDEAKAAKEKAEKQAVSATIINVNVEKDKKKKAGKGLVSRLSKKKDPPTQEQLEAASQVAQCNRDDATRAKVEKASVASKKMESAKERATTDQAKGDKKKAEAEVKKMEEERNQKES